MHKALLQKWLQHLGLDKVQHPLRQTEYDQQTVTTVSTELVSGLQQKILSGVIVVVTAFYPFLIWFSLDYFQPRSLALIMAGLFFLRSLSPNNRLSKTHIMLTPTCMLFLLTVALINQTSWLLAYPVFVSLLFFGVFAYSLTYPPSIIERLARLEEPDLPPKGIVYTRKVTQVWSGFFLMNAALSLATIWYGDPWWWSLYNGCVSYILMGLLMAAEMLVRRKVRASH